jgi:hypothetical protein
MSDSLYQKTGKISKISTLYYETKYYVLYERRSKTMIEITEEKMYPIYFVAYSYAEYLIFRTQLERFDIDYRIQITKIGKNDRLSIVFNSVDDVLDSTVAKLYDEIEKLSPSLVDDRFRFNK